jgi:hypothetical protein
MIGMMIHHSLATYAESFTQQILLMAHRARTQETKAYSHGQNSPKGEKFK